MQRAEIISTKANASFSPQIKICGLTRIDEALACAELGVNAIGVIFYSKSPRCIPPEQAKRIRDALPSHTAVVGVFVNEDFDAVMTAAGRTGIRTVQLHGQEPPELVGRLKDEGLLVIKALFSQIRPGLDHARDYADATAFLVEAGSGPMPGGNALVWDWKGACIPNCQKPLILAGGLSPENILQAIDACNPDAVDVSSGVEIRPGQKDIFRIRNLVDGIASSQRSTNPRRIFL